MTYIEGEYYHSYSFYLPDFSSEYQITNLVFSLNQENTYTVNLVEYIINEQDTQGLTILEHIINGDYTISSTELEEHIDVQNLLNRSSGRSVLGNSNDCWTVIDTTTDPETGLPAVIVQISADCDDSDEEEFEEDPDGSNGGSGNDSQTTSGNGNSTNPNDTQTTSGNSNPTNPGDINGNGIPDHQETGNTNGTSGTDNTNTHTGGSSNNPPNDDNTPLITTPVFEIFWNGNLEESRLINQLNGLLENNLTDEQIDFVLDNREFADEALEALQNGGKVDFEEQIINTLTGKSKCLHDHIEQAGSGSISDILSNFEGNNSEFTININSPDNVFYINPATQESEEVNGKTSFDGNIINITINTHLAATRPALDVVRTILHEYIHADIYRKLVTSNPTQGDLDFREIYNSYEDQRFEPTQQHQTMAQLYVDIMANALANYHRNVLVGDYNYLTNDGAISLDAFYRALAWNGLKDHNVQAYLDLSQTEKDVIADSLQQYYHATTSNCPN